MFKFGFLNFFRYLKYNMSDIYEGHSMLLYRTRLGIRYRFTAIHNSPHFSNLDAVVFPRDGCPCGLSVVVGAAEACSVRYICLVLICHHFSTAGVVW